MTRRPSGLTSTFIHVPSVVSNDTVLVGPVGVVMSHFSLGACAPEATVRRASAATESKRRIGVMAPLL